MVTCSRLEIIFKFQMYEEFKACNSVNNQGLSVNSKKFNYEIVIPSLNSVATIERSILSALAQSIAPKRITIHDNNSSDSSTEIVKKLVRKHRKLYLVEHNERVNAMLSYKRSLENVVGRVLILAADDLLAPDAVKKLIQLSKCPNKNHSIVPQQVFFSESSFTRGANFASIIQAKRSESKFLINPADNPFMYGLHDAQALMKFFPAIEFYGWDLWVSYNMLKSNIVHFIPREVIYIRDFTKRSDYINPKKNLIGTFLPLLDLSKNIWKQNGASSKILLFERLTFLNLHESLSLNGFKINQTMINLGRKVLEVRVWSRKYRKLLFKEQSICDLDERKRILALTKITSR